MSKRAFRSSGRSEGQGASSEREAARYPTHAVGRRAFLGRLGLLAAGSAAGSVAGSILAGCGDERPVGDKPADLGPQQVDTMGVAPLPDLRPDTPPPLDMGVAPHPDTPPPLDMGTAPQPDYSFGGVPSADATIPAPDGGDDGGGA